MKSGVAILLNPYQGLKRSSHGRSLSHGKVAILLNPYQGLKQGWQGISRTDFKVAILLNPYQGLKRVIISWDTLPNPSQFFLIPIRD